MKKDLTKKTQDVADSHRRLNDSKNKRKKQINTVKVAKVAMQKVKVAAKAVKVEKNLAEALVTKEQEI